MDRENPSSSPAPSPSNCSSLGSSEVDAWSDSGSDSGVPQLAPYRPPAVPLPIYNPQPRQPSPPIPVRLAKRPRGNEAPPPRQPRILLAATRLRESPPPAHIHASTPSPSPPSSPVIASPSSERWPSLDGNATDDELADEQAAAALVQPIAIRFEDEEDYEAEEDVVEYSRWLFEVQLPAPWTLIQSVRLDERRWVVEGFRNADGSPQPGSFYHLTSLAADNGFTSHCDCTDQTRILERCIHRLVLHHSWELFVAMEKLSVDDNPDCIAIIRNVHGYLAILSVRNGANSARDESKRVLVRWVWMNTWECDAPKCKKGALPSTACLHRGRARNYMREVFWNGEDIGDDVDARRNVNELGDMDEMNYLQRHLRDPVNARAYVETKPRSHLPIPSPAFCSLSTDKVPQVPFLFPHQLPAILPIGNNARCYCGSSGSDATTRLRACRVYDIDTVVDRFIETRRCDCRTKGDRHTIGPDLGEYGLFNWNNEIVIMHRLIDSYTSQAQRSETPLTAFHQHTNDQYLKTRSPYPFFAKTTFNKIQYALTDIQELDHPFECPLCGPNPPTQLWDGVRAAFGTQHRTSTLQPPTEPTGIECTCVRPRTDLVFLPNKELRTAMRSAADTIISINTDRSTVSDAEIVLRTFAVNTPKGRHREATAAASLLERLLIDPPSASLAQLYSTVLRQLSAHEAILYLVNRGCSRKLREVALAGKRATEMDVSRLARDCPAFGNLFRYFRETDTSPPPQLQLLAIAAADRTDAVFAKLDTHTHDHAASNNIPPEPWQKTGVVYGNPKIRERPLYAHFKDGGGTGEAGTRWGQAPGRDKKTKQMPLEAEIEGEQDKWCRKHYTQYTEARQTGGIMGGWCPHSFSLGFHNIPRAEGRNDVFSAVFTRWEKAPRTIIYDFGCALGIYCWAREPKYWRNTRFMIDQFHQSDHSACSDACRLSTYMKNDPDLVDVNSSAAECGNAGLARIRKTVSYSNQVHAIKFTRNFLCVWNRCRTLALSAKQAKGK
ncbi:hypothetical protein P7C70_g6480, partial [Phenoliferia sp. Uapishka_3]